ncbi:MAG: penicillin acylase family protein [Phenylobacterium sp.]|uniref:penicillin acylase family protein n=1 Tax=Phenylobacterium sp. TaxID=1871053 RepID=UPI001A37AEA9|nr:penicillin acylase family protein [Phenylobacterium sp.]MBL8553305.1 penicillin acylase family protein [Phenylobacterium sp.]
MRLTGLVLALALVASPAASQGVAEWKGQAARVSIVRDDWGIAHVRGKTDADAVFGMAYAQAEDDFNRIETNYLVNLGRLAEAEGQGAIWQDLRQRLYVDPADLQARYAASPAWLKALMDGWAAGLNHYLATHPQTRPRAIARFEPWMALSFTEGSIGGDIERISLPALEAFYGGARSAYLPREAAGEAGAPTGSNGIAIGPQITKDGHALLLINPHTSFFFRSELQMTSEDGLNAYGAVTWGQFFIYQGFNAHAGWMHTSSGVDVVDEFAETIIRTPDTLMYRYGKEARPVRTARVTIRYRLPDGAMGSREFTTYRTHHGPIVRADGDRWIAFAMMYKPVEALTQSYLRTKATDLDGFLKVAEAAKANSSNNTLFADDKGTVAYLHPQFIPTRNDRFDFTRPVDGADPATDWGPLHAFAERPNVVRPRGGWVFNVNDAPYEAAGTESPKAAAFPKYMDAAGRNARTEHAIRVLDGKRGFTREGLLRAAFDPDLPAFDVLIPALVSAWDERPAGDPMKTRLAEQVAALKAWDRRWSAGSTETSLAVFWAEALAAKTPPGRPGNWALLKAMAARTPAERLAALAEASDRLTADFGTWKTPWGQINRFQRLTGDIVQTFRDDGPSIAVPFTSAGWGSLAAFEARRYPGTKRYYGTRGNSFVSVVEFGPKVRALAVTAGGESGDPASPHFNDQAERYASGSLREVYFHPEQLAGHTERTYRPGE